MKTIVNLLLVMTFAVSLSAQGRYFDERYVSTQTQLFPVLINPGAIGATGDHQVVLNYRNNWSSFDGSPSTLTFSYDGDLGNKLSFGAQLLRDQYAALEMTKGLVGFAYAIESPTNKVSFGLSAEYIQNSLKSDLAGVDLQDPEVLKALDGTQYFDVSFGVHGRYNENVMYGVSLPSLLSSRISDSNSGDSEDRDFGFIFYGGYDYHSVANGLHIIPSVFIKQLNNTPTHIDLNVRFSFLEERLTSGIGYTVGADNRLGFLIGTKIDKAGFYYSYNISNNEFQSYNNGAHEISIGINLSNKTALQKAMDK